MVHRFRYGILPWHDSLLAAIMAERRAHPASSLGVANGAAWSGPKGVCAPELESLFRERLYCLTDRLDWRLSAWANVIEPHGSVGEHDHQNPGNLWSGAYYLTGGSAIVFPRFALHIQPEPGLLMIWHAQERHYVRPQPEGYSRVSVAMNAALAPVATAGMGRAA